MKEKPVSCDNCWQPCCDYRKVMFKFNPKEVLMMKEEGAKIRLVWWMLLKGKYYILDESCPFLAIGKCRLHGLPDQPECCDSNKAGGSFCLLKRSEEALNY